MWEDKQNALKLSKLYSVIHFEKLGGKACSLGTGRFSHTGKCMKIK